jgi:hypothetical protein
MPMVETKSPTDSDLLKSVMKTDVPTENVSHVPHNVSLVPYLLLTVIIVLSEEKPLQIVYVQMVNTKMLTTFVNLVLTNVLPVLLKQSVSPVEKTLTEMHQLTVSVLMDIMIIIKLMVFVHLVTLNVLLVLLMKSV